MASDSPSSSPASGSLGSMSISSLIVSIYLHPHLILILPYSLPLQDALCVQLDTLRDRMGWNGLTRSNSNQRLHCEASLPLCYLFSPQQQCPSKKNLTLLDPQYPRRNQCSLQLRSGHRRPRTRLARRRGREETSLSNRGRCIFDRRRSHHGLCGHRHAHCRSSAPWVRLGNAHLSCPAVLDGSGSSESSRVAFRIDDPEFWDGLFCVSFSFIQTWCSE